MPAHLHSRILPLSLLLALSQAGCVHLNSLPPLATVQPAQPALLIENARIFSGDADQAVSAGQDVLIEAGRIKAIGAHPLNVDASERIDARGKLLLPGLIDMHVHVGFTEAPPWYPTLGNPRRTLSAYAAHGVTTVLDLGGRGSELHDLAQQLAQGKLTGPRLLYAGEQFSAPGSHPAPLMKEILAWPLSSLAIALSIDPLAADSDVDALIGKRKQAGATLAKVMIDRIPLASPSTDEASVRRLVTAAHRQHMPVAAHIGDEQNLLTALNAGVDLLAHGVNRSGLGTAGLQRLQAAQVPVVPTLKIFNNIALAAQQQDPIEPADEKVIAPAAREAFRKPDGRKVTPAMYEYGQLIAHQREVTFANCRAMQQAGIPLLVGTDSPNMGSTAGSSIHQELQLLVEKCGLTPAQALAAATGRPGAWLSRWSGIAGLGSVSVGAPADLLLIDGDPLQDIRASRNISLVLTAGRKVTALPQAD